MIGNGEVEPNRIAKTVLVIDEAQDMSQEEYALVRALITANEEMRVIAVGDDDQNIFEFRGSHSRYMSQLIRNTGGKFVEMTENYRSSSHVVSFANAFVSGIRERLKATPLISMNKKDGFVSIHHHLSHTMYQPLVEDLMSHHGLGTTCVLAQTNEEAVILVALLRKHGLSSKLVQSMDGFRFWNMAEVRMFIKLIDKDTHSPLIPENVWEKAKMKTYEKYADSLSLRYLQRCILLFEQTNKAKYITDLKEFVFESSVEDFCDLSGADVVVSTIHKAKGREFDDVYMLITEPQHLTDEVLRRYYVGATRAKERLFIHTDCPAFDSMPANEHHICQQQYGMPDEIILQLSHRDVNLSFFKSRKKEILALRAGQELRFSNNYFYDFRSDIPIAQLSQKMQSDLRLWAEKRYEVIAASIRFIVAWRPKDAPKEEEHAILLIDLTLKVNP